MYCVLGVKGVDMNIKPYRGDPSEVFDLQNQWKQQVIPFEIISGTHDFILIFEHFKHLWYFWQLCRFCCERGLTVTSYC